MLATATKQSQENEVQGGGAASASTGERPAHQGHGRRLLAAFEALEAFPALAESRDRLLTVCSEEHASAEVISAVGSDVGLAVAVLRLANGRREGRGCIETIPAAIEQLGREPVRRMVNGIGVFDFFQRVSVWNTAPERFRSHALATQRIADRLAYLVDYGHRDRLTVVSLLHDIGKLVLVHAYPSYPEEVHRGGRTPEERVHSERCALGVDHGTVGGVLVRRWGLPASVARAIEHHHNPDAGGDACFVRLADMLAHHERGGRVSPGELLGSARAVGLDPQQLRRFMYELASSGGSDQRKRHSDPCPLSPRQFAALKRLAEGKVYKEIAHDLGLAPSTVRSHLHNVYRQIGANDRAQAVLIATERGWLD